MEWNVLLLLDPNIMYSELCTMGTWVFLLMEGKAGTILLLKMVTWVTPYEIDQSSPNRIVIGYDNVYESLDYGSSWQTISEAFNNSGSIDVICLSPSNDDVILISETEKLYKTSDGGENWNNKFWLTK